MTLAIFLQVQPSLVDSTTKAKIAANSEKFSQIDPFGVGLTFIGMFVVFMSLLVLYLMFMNITKLLALRIKKKKLMQQPELKDKMTEEPVFTGEINAAICLAVGLYLDEIHDKESAILTINRVAKTYSPWSSKIYGLRQYPR